MTDAEKLTALADEIAAGFTREPWRDQRGMGYVEVQMDRADEEEYREMAARIAQLEAERDALAAALEWLVGDHNAPSDCFSTGPITGTPKDDLCPACAAVRYLESGVISPALFAARDARMKREGAREALRGVCAKLIPAFSLEGSQYCKGWNDGLHSALGEVRAALAALEQKGEKG